MRLALLDDYHGVAMQMADWASLAPRVEIVSLSRHIADIDALLQQLARFDAVVAMRERTPLPRAVLERLPDLRLIVTTGMWNASIDVACATERGIQVCGTGDAGHATAELTLGLMLSLARQIPHEERALRNGQWQVRLGSGLRDKTLGVLGLGNLGRQVSTLARAFGMTVIAWSRNLTAEAAAAAGARLVSREQLFADADYVTIHVRLSDRTRGLVGAREIARMKPGAYLVNTSRGPIVDEEALLDALRRRAIAGAALDVYSVEPLPPQAPIRNLDNVILLPHIGYVIEENYRLMYGHALEDVAAFLDGKVVRPLNAIAR
jgi:phosphoglycerate dehydrogenase-like enzyme